MLRTMQGDTFEEIAWREYGTTGYAEALMNANRAQIETQEFEAGVELEGITLESSQEVVKAPWG